MDMVVEVLQSIEHADKCWFWHTALVHALCHYLMYYPVITQLGVVGADDGRSPFLTDDVEGQSFV